MAWDVPAWLLFGRTVQLLGSLAAAILHAYLTIIIHVDNVGLTKEMVVLQLLACIIVAYSIFAIVFQRPGRPAKTTSGMKGFVVCDVLMCAALLGIINMLSHAGLPQNCGGLTRREYPPGEDPFPYHTNLGFSGDGRSGHGRLDPQCGFERAYFGIANTVIFTYMLTITATVLSIFSRKYTKNTKVNEMLDALERAEEISLKLLDTAPSPPPELPRMDQPPPPSEGIITRNTSLRSNFTAATSVASSQTNPYRTHHAARRSVAAIPRRPLPPPSSPTGHSNPTVGFIPVPLEEDDPAEAALVADGMQHRPQPQPQYHPNPNHHHHFSRPQQNQQQQNTNHHRQTHSSSSSSSATHPRMLPMLSEEDGHSAAEAAAASALVSDGMRPSEPTLPPYHPGNRRMSGHGDDEDNEMRLSGYVKGQTRAQGMKDSGGY